MPLDGWIVWTLDASNDPTHLRPVKEVLDLTHCRLSMTEAEGCKKKDDPCINPPCRSRL